MLNKPKFMSPNTNMQKSTMDISSDTIPFSCIVDGNEAIFAWKIEIRLLEGNAVVFDTGKQLLSKPFFPIDEKNRNAVFSIDLKKYISDIESSSFVNSEHPYYWTISFWNKADNDNDTTGISPTTKSCEEVFYANSAPEITLQYGKEIKDTSDNTYIDFRDYDVNVTLDSKKYFFKALYTQKESIQLKRYGWRITDKDSGQVFLDTITSNQIYGVADNIVCSYDGFLDGGSYNVELFVETQNNDYITTSPYVFSVSYSTSFLSNDFRVETLKNEPAIMLDWGKSIVIGGRMIDGNGNNVSVEDINFKKNYPIIDYNSETPNTSIEIPKNYSLVYDYGSSSNLDISEDCYVVLSTQIFDNTEKTLFTAEGIDKNGYEVVRRLTFAYGVFTYSVLGKGDVVRSVTYSVQNQPSKYVWYVIKMSPLIPEIEDDYSVELKVTESICIKGVYPSSKLYPSGKLYPTFGVWDKLKEDEE